MKKYILTLVAVLAFLVGSTQTTYKAFQAEWYLYNEKTEEWVEQTSNKDLSISVVMFKDVVNIQAQRPTLYRISQASKKLVNTNEIGGYEYEAFEYVEMQKCKLSLLKLKEDNSNVFVLSIIINDSGRLVNLRYFLTVNE